MSRGRIAAISVLSALSICATVTACEPERYFGPFDLNVPTSLHELSDSRTFELPLDSQDIREFDNLTYCLEHEPDRQIPCRCDYPVLSCSEQYVRLDYHLNNSSQYPVNATVWVGVEVPAQWSSPRQVPDLPRVALLASHTHRVKSGQEIDDIIDEVEMSQAQELYSDMFFDACESSNSRRPSPMSIVSGLSMNEEDEGEVAMEFTVRVRRAR